MLLTQKNFRGSASTPKVKGLVSLDNADAGRDRIQDKSIEDKSIEDKSTEEDSTTTATATAPSNKLYSENQLSTMIEKINLRDDGALN